MIDSDEFEAAYEDMLKDAVEITVTRTDTGQVIMGGDMKDVPLKNGQRGAFLLVPLPGVVSDG